MALCTQRWFSRTELSPDNVDNHLCLNDVGIAVSKSDILSSDGNSIPYVDGPDGANLTIREYTLTGPIADGVWGSYRLKFASEPRSVTVTPLWQRYFGHVIADARPKAECAHLSALRSRKDGSVLQALCLENSAVIVTQEVSSNRLVLSLLNMATGDIVSRQLLPEGARSVDHLIIESNRIALIYENTNERRYELKLTEVFSAHRKSSGLPTWLSGGSKAQKQPPHSLTRPTGEEESEEGLHIFDETFSLGSESFDAVAFTQTGKLVTPQTLVGVSSATGLFSAAHPKALSARRPVPQPLLTAAEGLEGMGTALDNDIPPYDPFLQLQPVDFITRDKNAAIESLLCYPTDRESATECRMMRNGVEETIIYRPASGYDGMPQSFSTSSTLGTLGLLIGATIYVFYRLRGKGKADAWH